MDTKLDFFLRNAGSQIRRVKSDYEYHRDIRGNVTISFTEKTEETTGFLDTVTDEKTFHTVALQFDRHEDMDTVAEILSRERIEGTSLYHPGGHGGYACDHFKSLGFLLFKVATLGHLSDENIGFCRNQQDQRRGSPMVTSNAR